MTTCLGNCCSPGCRLWCLWWCLFVLSFFPWDVLDEILNLIESVSEGFPSYSYIYYYFTLQLGTFVIFPVSHRKMGMDYCGGQRVCCPPSQIIGGPAPPPPPLPTPMHVYQKIQDPTSSFFYNALIQCMTSLLILFPAQWGSLVMVV